MTPAATTTPTPPATATTPATAATTAPPTVTPKAPPAGSAGEDDAAAGVEQAARRVLNLQHVVAVEALEHVVAGADVGTAEGLGCRRQQADRSYRNATTNAWPANITRESFLLRHQHIIRQRDKKRNPNPLLPPLLTCG